MDVCIVAVAMSEHTGYRNGDLSKSIGGLSSALHLWNCRSSVIHLVMNNAENSMGLSTKLEFHPWYDNNKHSDS